MISCAERDPVRRRTLANLAQTDWPDRPVQVQMDAGEGEDRRARQTRCAYEALRAAPDSDYVLFLEDDLEFNRHLWHNLMHWRPLRERRMALAGLYNPGLREFACDRFTGSRLVTPDSVFGSQALLISREARKYIVANWNRVSGMQDIRISRLAGRLETPFYYHAPSLVQHVGKISAWGGWFHEAADFDAEWKRDKKMLTTK
jgi:hypothetical protein